MHVIVQSKTLPVTQALRAFVDHQASKLEKLADITKLCVFLENVGKKSNDPQAATVQYLIEIPGRKAVVVRRRAVDMYEAIVDATERAMRQVSKVKERRLSEWRHKNVPPQVPLVAFS